MNSLSYWEYSSFFSNIDVVIIGSGIVGLTTAISLNEMAPKLKIVILERGSLPHGASTKNAGFACFGSMTELISDIENRSEEQVFKLVEERWKGLLKLRNILSDQAIGFQQLGGYELFTAKDDESYRSCMSRLKGFNAILQDLIGLKNVFCPKDNLLSKFGFRGVNHLLFNSAEGQIDTGKMMKNLMKKATSSGIEILNGIEVKEIEEEGSMALIHISETFKFTAKKVIVATNGFSSKLIAGLDLVPARNQVLVTNLLDNLPFQGCFHIEEGFYYFRNIDTNDANNRQRILIGGGRNLAPNEEETTEFGQTSLIQDTLESILHEVILPGRFFEIDYRWSGILGVGKSKEPIVKKLSPSIFAAVRLGGMGVAIGSLTGEKAATLVFNNL